MDAGAELQQEKGKEGLTAAERAVELRAFSKLTTQRANLIAQYRADNDNYVSADTAKSYFDDYPHNPARHANATHRPAMELAHTVYEQVLPEAPLAAPVLFTAGGTAAGKTYSVTTATDLGHYAAVLDSNLAAYGTATRLIDEVLATGRQVEVRYIFADHEVAFLRAIVRAREEGRTIPIATHVSTHTGSIKVVRRLIETYRKDPRVDIAVIDNTIPRDAHVISDRVIDFLTDRTYSSGQAKRLTEHLYAELEHQYHAGTISADIAHGFGYDDS